jgi:hypothetical protein
MNTYTGEDMNVDTRDGKGNTLLHHACMQNKKKVKPEGNPRAHMNNTDHTERERERKRERERDR